MIFQYHPKMMTASETKINSPTSPCRKRRRTHSPTAESSKEALDVFRDSANASQMLLTDDEDEDEDSGDVEIFQLVPDCERSRSAVKGLKSECEYTSVS